MTMKNSNNTRRSFLQDLTDGDTSSLDYSADWDTFSFENEIETRNHINNENLQALKLITESSYTTQKNEEMINQLYTNIEMYTKLLKENKLLFSNYDKLIEEQNIICNSCEKLELRKRSLEDAINNSEKEENVLRKEYKQLKLALHNGVETYTTLFDLNVTVENKMQDIYEASIEFKSKKDMPPLKFSVDRKLRKVIDFHVSEVLLSEEEENIRKKFGNLENLPGLLCALREIIF